jgi:hypothetical protein
MCAYSSEELDVMADAYLLALQSIEGACASPELAEILVDTIGAGVARGMVDEHALAAEALRAATVSRPNRRRNYDRSTRFDATDEKVLLPKVAPVSY